MKIKRGSLLLIVAALSIFLISVVFADFSAITQNFPANNTATTNNTLTFNFTPTSISNSTVDCDVFVDNTSVGAALSIAANVSNNVTINATAGLANGTRVWYVNCTGNVSFSNSSVNHTLFIDTAVPVVNITGPVEPDGNNTNTSTNTTQQINFSVQDAISVTLNYTLRVDGVITHSGNATNSTNTSVDVNLTNGTHSITVQVNDNATNFANSTPLIISLDQLPPEFNVTNGTHNVNNSNTSTTTANGVQINFTLIDNLSIGKAGDTDGNSSINYSIFVDGVLNISNQSAQNGTMEFVNISGLTNSSYNITVESYDQLGNTVNDTFNITIDQVKPNITGMGPNVTQSSLSVVIEAATNESATCRHSTGNTTYGNMTQTMTTTTGLIHTRTITAVSGANTIYILCQDAQGNNMTPDTNDATDGILSFTVTLSGGSGNTATSTASSSGGGGGGGGASSVSTTASESTTTALTKRVYTGSKKSFTHKGSAHSVTVDSVDVTAQTATITIASDPVTLTLKVGEAKTVDTDGNGRDDLSIMLKRIASTFADVEIMEVQEAVPAPEVPEPIVEPEAVPVEQAQVTSGSSTTIIVIVVMVILALIIIASLAGKKNKR